MLASPETAYTQHRFGGPNSAVDSVDLRYDRLYSIITRGIYQVHFQLPSLGWIGTTQLYKQQQKAVLKEWNFKAF